MIRSLEMHNKMNALLFFNDFFVMNYCAAVSTEATPACVHDVYDLITYYTASLLHHYFNPFNRRKLPFKSSDVKHGSAILLAFCAGIAYT
jgi:hypothetical protein